MKNVIMLQYSMVIFKIDVACVRRMKKNIEKHKENVHDNYFTF